MLPVQSELGVFFICRSACRAVRDYNKIIYRMPPHGGWGNAPDRQGGAVRRRSCKGWAWDIVWAWCSPLRRVMDITPYQARAALKRAPPASAGACVGVLAVITPQEKSHAHIYCIYVRGVKCEKFERSATHGRKTVEVL